MLGEPGPDIMDNLRRTRLAFFFAGVGQVQVRRHKGRALSVALYPRGLGSLRVHAQQHEQCWIEVDRRSLCRHARIE